GLRDAPEGADQIYLDDLREILERKMPDLAGLAGARRGLGRDSHAGAVDKYPLLAMRGARLGEGGIDLRVRGHVHLAEGSADLARDDLAGRRVEIEDGDPRPFGRERPRRRLTQSRGSPGHHRRAISDIHSAPPPVPPDGGRNRCLNAAGFAFMQSINEDRRVNMDLRLNGKRAILAGASKGIG